MSHIRATLEPAVQGARRTPRTITWTNKGVPQNLTGATLTGRKVNLATGVATDLDGALAVTDAANGVFTWTLGENDVAVAGDYLVWFKAAYSGGQFDATFAMNWTVEALP